MIHNLIILSFALACTTVPVQEIPADYELTSAAQIPEQELFEGHRGGWTGRGIAAYSVAATATALLLLSILAVTAAVRARRTDKAADKAATAAAAADNTVADNGSGKPDEYFISRMEDILALHISEPDFSVEEMAREMAMSRAAFFRKVKESAGTTPYRLMMSIRLNKAAQLLSGGSSSINEVSRMVGIKDTSHFIRLFKDTFGLTPKEYRRKQQGSGPEKPLPNQEK